MNINISFRHTLPTFKFFSAALLFLLGGFNAFAQESQDAPTSPQRKFALAHEPPEIIEFLKISGYKSENWLDDFALEIKNKSDKPIYYFAVMLDVLDTDRNDDKFDHNNEMNVWLEFGDRKLYGSNWMPEEEKDPRINPGETITLTISAKEKEAYRTFLARRLQDASISTDHVAKLILHLMKIRYGDGSNACVFPRKLCP